jgi:hypothetical protein
MQWYKTFYNWNSSPLKHEFRNYEDTSTWTWTLETCSSKHLTSVVVTREHMQFYKHLTRVKVTSEHMQFYKHFVSVQSDE